MKFASVRDLRTSVAAVLSKAGREESLIVTSRGKPVALFVPVSEEGLEDMIRAVKTARLRETVEKIRRGAAASGAARMSAAEIDKEIKAVRRAKHA